MFIQIQAAAIIQVTSDTVLSFPFRLNISIDYVSPLFLY